MAIWGKQALAGAALLIGSQAASAAVMTYTDAAAFLGAVGSAGFNAHTTTFDDVGIFTPIASGSMFDGMVFTYNLVSGMDLEVNDGFGTASAPNHLGQDGDGLLPGDGFSLDFSASNAIGLFVTGLGEAEFDTETGTTTWVAPAAHDGDITLTAAGTSVSLDTSMVQYQFPEMDTGWFLGIINDDPAQAFTQAVLTSAADADFVFTMDNISRTGVAVPSPASVLLLLVGLGGLAVRRGVCP